MTAAILEPDPAALSRDRLRLAIFGQRQPTDSIRESIITAVLSKALNECLSRRIPVELDDPAATTAGLAEYARIAAACHVELPGLPPAPPQTVYTPDPTLPPVWIFDLDGTLCLNESGRGWYDMSRVAEDSQNPAVTAVLRAVTADGTRFIVVTGRSEDGISGTLEWFDRHQLPRPLHIYARPADSPRPGEHVDAAGASEHVPDDQFKEAVFFEHVAPHFRVLGVFEDRNSVVDMWRRVGLTCFHVADGDY